MIQEEINLTDKDIEEYASDQIDGWDTDSLVSFAIDTLYNDYISMDRKKLLDEMVEYYGEDWLKRKKLSVFK